MGVDINALLRAEIGKKPKYEAVFTLGDVEITAYSGPITPSDMIAVEKEHPGFEQNPTQGGLVELLIHKAVDENGKRIFAKGRDKPLLLLLPSTKITEIVQALFGDAFRAAEITDESVRSAEGN
jgi:hypothetical protein